LRILFLLKKQHSYSCENSNYCSSGLLNSAKFVVDMLLDAGIEAYIKEVIDNNDIDREVTQVRPDVVIIEALWVVPEKFDILQKLHPNVEWIVRMHSDIPFLAGEGVAMDWIFGYLGRGVEVAFNSPKLVRDFREIASEYADSILYLPNYYPVEDFDHWAHGDTFRVGCFGAIRPMKNQLLQAVAAIRFAVQTDRNLEFWINATRCEENGGNVLKNLRGLFRNAENANWLESHGRTIRLVELPWLKRRDFLEVMGYMDVALCDSFSETFCITAADAVNTGTPLICSSEVPWASSASIVEMTDSESVVRKLYTMTSPVRHFINKMNRHGLKKYSKHSRKIWLEQFS
jgi:hypothetical protein